MDIIAGQDCVGAGVEPDISERYSRANRFRSLTRLNLIYEVLKFARDGLVMVRIPAGAGTHQVVERLGNLGIQPQLNAAAYVVVPHIAQIALTAPYVEKQITYQYPGLMHNPKRLVPVTGEKAAILYENYTLYREALLAGRITPLN